MIHIAPSILAADFRRLEHQIQAAEAGGADMIHCDIMDGHFVPNISFGPMIVEAVRRVTDLPIDTHLMIANPEAYIEPFYEAGTDYLTVHVEATAHLNRLIDRIKSLGMKAGVALNPATPISFLEEVLAEVDLILIMTVNPGFGGQTFLHGMLDKIYRLKLMCEARGYKPHIEADGGIDEQTGAAAVKAGATILVAGSSLFGQSDITAAVRALKQKAVAATQKTT